MARPKDPNSIAGKIRELLADNPDNKAIALIVGCKATRVAQIRRKEGATVAKSVAEVPRAPAKPAKPAAKPAAKTKKKAA